MESFFVGKGIQIVMSIALQACFATGRHVRKGSIENRNEIQKLDYVCQGNNASRGGHQRIHALDLVKPNTFSTS